jgi:predicted extracellular nuclease/2',3'-cyclic-nucleotide 2'-phosphodiesterase (5'-nucleotidase family)
MPAPRSHRRARLAALVSAALAVTGFQFFIAPQGAQAASSTVVINEVYMNGGSAGATYTNRYVELKNLTGSAIPLTGMSLQYRPATNSGNAGNVTALTGTIPANGYYVVTGTSNGANGVAVPNANQTSALPMAGGGGTVILASGTTAVDPSTAPLVDKLSYGTGNTPEGNASGAGPTGNSVTKSLGRNGTSTDTDFNNPDFTAQDPTPGAVNTSSGPAALSLSNPGAQTSTVGTAISPLSLNASGGAPPYTFGATNLPSGLSITTAGVISGTPDTAGTPTVTISVSDSAGTPATDSKSFVWTVNAAPSGVTPIKDIQGSGSASPLVGQVVSTQGVVTAAYPTGGLNGFYIQTAGPDTANASDAIFVQGAATFPAVGDSVDVTGTVSEDFDLTRLTGATWSAHTPTFPAVTFKEVIPGTDCTEGSCPDAAALDTAREAVEGEAFKPGGGHPWTLTDVYDGAPYYSNGTNNVSANFGELGVAAESNKALVAPTEIFDAQNQATQVANRKAYNDAHRIILDDGSTVNYNLAANKGTPVPWMTQTYQPRVGAAVTFPGAVVVVKDFGAWRALPSTQVTGEPTATQPQPQQTRSAIAAGPEDVGGDVKLATFNVLNFFPTTGNEYVAAGGGNVCTYFTDRDGAQTTTNQCGNPNANSGNGPRGAANAANLQRQRDKIVAAINTANADIVSLEELENSVKFGKNRDFAIGELVDALNVGHLGKWAFVPSPAPADLPAVGDQDVIRTGFIYQPANIALVGTSRVLANQSSGTGVFANAREPLAQAFKKVGSPDADAFAVIVNHFKSKGSGFDDGTGQGNANPDRVAQANSLVTFANQFQTDRGISRTFLVGDFNAYSEEDPAQVLTGAGYTELHSTFDSDEESYNFDGQLGSLDHVFANSAAAVDVNAVDVWPINSYESVYYEYSRYNNNVTDLYLNNPFRSSDHNPELVGIDVPAVVEPATRQIQILGTNDFHGRLQRETGSPTAGAAVMAGAVEQLRAQNPDTVFAAAGDLIGASTFESFIQHDKPTLEALSKAGLEVSAAGNHEFDQGYDDLVNRVMKPYDAQSNPYGAVGGLSWQYIAANLTKKVDGNHALPPTWTKDFGSVKVGFIGAVTEDLPSLVSPAGISDINVNPIVPAVNLEADALKQQGADIVVLLVHEGAAGTDCNAMKTDPNSKFTGIINGVDDNVDAIISGHTHLSYNCHFPVAGWANRPVKERPVVSAGQYGMQLDKLTFTVDTASNQVTDLQQSTVDLQSCQSGCGAGQTPVYAANFPADSEVAQIVSDAVSQAATLGAVKLGNLGGPFFRGKNDSGTENRGAESTLGNLVAEVQKWATRTPEAGQAQIAIMNPGGLRQDMTGTGSGAFPRDLTYQQAAVVQPFANTLVNELLTGAQIKTALEQQWQRDSQGNVPSRPFLKLGISKGFKYTFDPSRPEGSRITGMWLNGTPIDPATSYSVTVNSFLAAGGDNFRVLANGTNKHDTGQTDLAAMVAYMNAFGSGSEQVTPDYGQNGVGIAFPVDAPASYAPGDHVKFDVSSWSMTNAADTKDTAVTVKAGSTTLGTATLANTPESLPGFDSTGKASVDVVVPNDQPLGQMTLTLVGTQTGTQSQVTVTVGKGNTQAAAGDTSVVYGQAAPIQVTVTGAGATPTGTVHLIDGATEVTSGTLDGTGKVTLTVPAKTYVVGQVTLEAVYDGDAGHNGSEKTLTLTTTKAPSTTTAANASMVYGQAGSVPVTVSVPNVTPTGSVTLKEGATVIGTAVVSGGSATVSIPGTALTAGTYSLTAEYSGNGNVATSSGALTVTVAKAGSSTSAEVKPKHPKPGHKVKLKVTVAGANGVAATGDVKVRVNGNNYTGTLANGRVTVTVGKLDRGTYHAKVVYLGSANVEASTDKVKFEVS